MHEFTDTYLLLIITAHMPPLFVLPLYLAIKLLNYN